MAFNPLQNYLQGQQVGTGQKVNRLAGEVTKMSMGGVPLKSNPSFQELLSIDPDRANKISSAFANLSKERKQAFYEDMVTAQSMLGSGDVAGTLKFLKEDRGEAIKSFGGDSFTNDNIITDIENKQPEKALDSLNKIIAAGEKMKYLSETKSKDKNKLGTYTPSDYTVESWSEFAKYGDPSILERYESESRERGLQIRESAQQIKEEKFEIDKQKEEVEKIRREITAAQKRKDADRAKFLEVAEGQNAINNINSLLDNDLDLIYGSKEWLLPDKLRGQRGKNMLARRDQIASTMSLMAAGKLKGQGTITENERAMLSEAVSFLKNEDVEPELAREELERVLPIFQYFTTGERPKSMLETGVEFQGFKVIRE